MKNQDFGFQGRYRSRATSDEEKDGGVSRRDRKERSDRRSSPLRDGKHPNEVPGGDWRVLRDGCLEDLLAAKSRETEEKTRIRGITPGQCRYLETLEKSTVTLCLGPAGTGKTWMACGKAAEELSAGRIRKIVLARPLIGCDEELGALKGGLHEKVGPYAAPMLDAFSEFFRPKEFVRHLEEERILLCPLAMMRGSSFKNAVVILDEAQNATYRQLHMFLTRFGEGCRVVVCGDPGQSDLTGGETAFRFKRNRRRPEETVSPLERVVRRLGGNPEIGVVRLGEEDVVRHGLVGWIDARLASPGVAGRKIEEKNGEKSGEKSGKKEDSPCEVRFFEGLDD